MPPPGAPPPPPPPPNVPPSVPPTMPIFVQIPNPQQQVLQLPNVQFIAMLAVLIANKLAAMRQPVAQPIATPTTAPRRAGSITTRFTASQTAILEREFSRNRYVSRERKMELAIQLSAVSMDITMWFSYRRRKEKAAEERANKAKSRK